MMNLRVYLKTGIELKSVKGYRANPRSDRKSGQTWEEHHINDSQVFNDSGRWYFTLGDLRASVSTEIVEVVEEITYFEWLDIKQHREEGIYRHGSAVAELEYSNGGAGLKPNVRVHAQKVEDIAELVHLIKTGQIRPEESYEVPQDGLSGKQLRERVAELEHLLEASRRREITKDNLDNLTSFRMAMTRVRGLRDYLQRGKNLPLTKRGVVISILDGIIENTSSASNG